MLALGSAQELDPVEALAEVIPGEPGWVFTEHLKASHKRQNFPQNHLNLAKYHPRSYPKILIFAPIVDKANNEVILNGCYHHIS